MSKNWSSYLLSSSYIELTLTYKLSYRDLRYMIAERGVDPANTTILRLVLRYVPEFEKKWNRLARLVGRSWRVDETYIRVREEWKYLYRVVDQPVNTVDFLLSEHRDIDAAKRFFTRAIKKHGAPERITLDRYVATHTAVDELKESSVLPMNVCVRTSKYLNNLIEQDHRRVKQRVYSMFGCKRFRKAAVTISEVALAHKLKEGQFDTSMVEQTGVRAPQVWEAVLAA
ncbi:MAG: IS6 family transposase [Blastocatellia bacterium]